MSTRAAGDHRFRPLSRSHWPPNDLQIVDRNAAGLAFGISDPALETLRLVHRYECMTKEATRNNVRPIGDGTEVVDEPAKRGLSLGGMRRPPSSAAERDLAHEVQGRRDQDRRTFVIQPKPAVTR